jgi:anti-sigma B factor antagonist
MPAVSVSTGNPAVTLSGEIDMATADAVVAALTPWVRAGGPVTLDLSDVTFMDSTGLHAVLKAAAALEARGCVVIHGAHGPVWDMLQITKADAAMVNLHFIECGVLAGAA